MSFNSLMLQSKAGKVQQLGYEIGSFIGDHLFLVIALILGIVVAIVMRKNLKLKP